MESPDGYFCLCLLPLSADDTPCLPEDPPGVNKSSSVGRGVDGGGGTITGSDGRVDRDLALWDSLRGENAGLGSALDCSSMDPFSVFTVFMVLVWDVGEKLRWDPSRL